MTQKLVVCKYLSWLITALLIEMIPGLAAAAGSKVGAGGTHAQVERRCSQRGQVGRREVGGAAAAHHEERLYQRQHLQTCITELCHCSFLGPGRQQPVCSCSSLGRACMIRSQLKQKVHNSHKGVVCGLQDLGLAMAKQLVSGHKAKLDRHV